MKRGLVTTGAIAAALGPFGFAVAAAQPLTLQQTVAYALDHNAAIAAKKSVLAQAEADWTRQRATEYPPVVATLQNVLAKQNNYAGPYAQYGITPVSNFSQNTAQVGTQWALYNGSLNQILTQQNRRKVEAARADLRQTQTQTTQRLVEMFFAIANCRQLYALAQANLVYQSALLQLAQAKERAGLVAGVDVLRAEVGVEQTQAALLRASADQETARESLAQVIGASLETAFALPAVLPMPPVPDGSGASLVAIADRNRPEVAAAQASVAIAQLARATIDTDLLPQVSVYAAFGNQTSPTTFVDQQTQVDTLNAQCASNPNQISCVGFPFANVSRGTPGFWNVGATTTFSLPIVDYGTRAAAHRAANATVQSAQLELLSAQSAAEQDVLQALRDARTARQTVAYERKAADLGSQAARIAQLQYGNGLASLTDTKAAQATSLQTQDELFSAQIAYINAVVRLRCALGTFDPAATVADL